MWVACQMNYTITCVMHSLRLDPQKTCPLAMIHISTNRILLATSLWEAKRFLPVFGPRYIPVLLQGHMHFHRPKIFGLADEKPFTEHWGHAHVPPFYSPFTQSWAQNFIQKCPAEQTRAYQQLPQPRAWTPGAWTNLKESLQLQRLEVNHSVIYFIIWYTNHDIHISVHWKHQLDTISTNNLTISPGAATRTWCAEGTLTDYCNSPIFSNCVMTSCKGVPFLLNTFESSYLISSDSHESNERQPVVRTFHCWFSSSQNVSTQHLFPHDLLHVRLPWCILKAIVFL